MEFTISSLSKVESTITSVIDNMLDVNLSTPGLSNPATIECNSLEDVTIVLSTFLFLKYMSSPVTMLSTFLL